MSSGQQGSVHNNPLHSAALHKLDDFLSDYTAVYNKAKDFYKNNYPSLTDSVIEAKAHKLAEVRLGLTTAINSQSSSTYLPLPPQPNTRHSLPTQQTIGGFFSNTARQQMLKLHKPLAENEIPEPRDLSLFWENAEDILQGMHPSIDVHTLNPAALKSLGPCVLGRAGWRAIVSANSGVDPATWAELKKITDAEFGLTKRQIRSRFKALRPNPSEDSASFVLRVDQQRKLINYRQSECLDHFTHFFEASFAAECDQQRRNALLRDEDFEWNDVVKIARDFKYSAKIGGAPPTQTTATGNPFAEPTPAPVVTVAPVKAQQRHFHKDDHNCDYCEDVGMGGSKHPRDSCYIDPKSKAYRPAVRQRRLQAAIDAGKTIPARILADAPFTPAQRQSPKAQNFVEGIMTMLAENVDWSSAEQQQVKELLEEGCRDEPTGNPFIGGLFHVNDGIIPESINQVKSMTEQLIQQFNPPQTQHSNIEQLVEQVISANQGIFAAADQAASSSGPHNGAVVQYQQQQRSSVVPYNQPSRVPPLPQGPQQQPPEPTYTPPQVNIPPHTGVTGVSAQTQPNGGVDVATQIRMQSNKTDPKAVDEIIRRLRVSVPMMKQLKVDHHLRQVMLTQLISLNQKHGQSIIVPNTLKVQTVSEEDYGKVMDAFAGVNEDNYDIVQQKLTQLGLTAPPIAPNQAAPPVNSSGNPFSSETNAPARNKRPRADPQHMISQLTDLISQIATLTVPDNLHNVAFTHSSTNMPHNVELGPVPYWAAPCHDKRQLMTWDSDQYVAQLRLGHSYVLGLVDTGACRTIMDARTAQACGLQVIKAESGNFGSYATPGCGATDYYGIIKGPVKFTFSPGLELELPYVRVVDHPHCLLLLGADILRPGKSSDEWSFLGVVNKTYAADQASSYLVFTKHGTAIDNKYDQSADPDIVRSYLQQYQIYDENATWEQQLARYNRFCGVTFGEDVVPKDVWPKLFNDLLKYEEHFASSQNDIGRCKSFKFDIELNDKLPPSHKAIPFPPEERAWIKQEMENLCKKGVVERVSGVDFASSLVLVKDGQSGQDFRLCGNFPDLNACTKLIWYFIPGCKSIPDRFYKSNVYSSTDMKAGFMNVEATERAKNVLGLVTQDGLYRACVMMFGLVLAPFFFQYMVEELKLRSKIPDLKLENYFDDGTVYGDDWPIVWEHTLEWIRILAEEGIMINIKKCKFLVSRVELLGLLVHCAGVQLGTKSMKSWFQVQLPKTFKGIQAIVGKLNFAAPFVPNYKQLIRPIEALLSRKSNPKWTEPCTQALNQLIKMVFKRLRLELPDHKRIYRIYVGISDDIGVVVIVQQYEVERPVYMTGRKILLSEQKLTNLEQLLMIASWGVRQFAPTLVHAPGIEVVLPWKEQVDCIHSKDVHMKLKARLLELEMYNCRYVVGKSVWQSQSEIVDFSSADDLTLENELQPPQWKHEDIVINKPNAARAPACKFNPSECCHVYFDGGLANKVPTAGYVGFLPGGSLWFGAGILLDRAIYTTHNDAEFVAAQWAVERILQQPPPEGTRAIQVSGDSTLVIDFYNRVSSPNKPCFVKQMKKMHALLKKSSVPIYFQHISREFNKVADWLTNIPRHLQRNVDILELCPHLMLDEDPPFDASKTAITLCDSINYCVKPQHESVPLCNLCFSAIYTTEARQCGNCLLYFHLRCLAQNVAFEGPWHCPDCYRKLQLQGIRDLTLDVSLMQFICSGQLPTGLSRSKIARILKCSSWVLWYENRVQVVSQGVLKQVPRLGERETMVREFAGSLGYPGGLRVYLYLRERYFWSGMQADIYRWCAEQLPNQAEKASFHHPPYLFPTHKQGGLFHTWQLDFAEQLIPHHPSGYKHLLICVDPMSKWLEVGKFTELTSGALVSWFHENITCRYGAPVACRTDNGKVFLGDFKLYLEDIGVRQCRVSAYNARANGLAERYVGLVKSGFRKLKTQFPQGEWFNFLPEILAGLRMLPSKIGMSPYMMVYKQCPRWHTLHADVILGEAKWPTDEQLQRLIEQQLTWWDQAVIEIRSRLTKQDQRMVKQYMKRTHGIDPRFAFKVGDFVLLRQRYKGKLNARCEGPYKFIEYLGSRQVVAIIEKQDGRRLQVSVINLVPLRGDARRIVEHGLKWRANMSSGGQEQTNGGAQGAFSSDEDSDLEDYLSD